MLYVGGLDPLSLPENVSFIPGLLGALKNLIIGGTQVDLSCPTKEQNTALGFIHAEEECMMECAEGSVCVEFASEPYCSCQGGFHPQACQDRTAGELNTT